MLVQSFWGRARVLLSDSGPFIFDTLSLAGFPGLTFGFEIFSGGGDVSLGFCESFMKGGELGVAR